MRIKKNELIKITSLIGSDVILGVKPQNTILSLKGKIKKEELAKFRNETLQNLKKRKTSGTNAYIWKNAGPDKMLSTQVFKNESGAYVETDDSWTEISTRVSE